MENVSATDAARNFAEVLDAVEDRGTTFIITRRGRPIARLGPAPAADGASLKELLSRHKPDRAWARELRELRAGLPIQEREWND